MAAHLPRLLLAWAVSQGRSVGFFFCDIVSAYYSVFTALVTGVELHDHNVAQLFASLGWGPDALQEFVTLLEQASAMSDAGVPPHLAASAAEALRNTWCTFSGCARVAMARRGSRPGDPLADLIFAFGAARMLREVRTTLLELGLLELLR